MAGGTQAYRGRPLLFVFGFVGTWIVARMLLPNFSTPTAIVPPLPKMTVSHTYEREAPGAETITIAIPQPLTPRILMRKAYEQGGRAKTEYPLGIGSGSAHLVAMPHTANSVDGKVVPPSLRIFALGPSSSPVPDIAVDAFIRTDPHVVAHTPPNMKSRLYGSAWLFWRDGSGSIESAPGALSPRYGASQAGLRLAYRFDEKGRVEMYGRATAALQSPGKDIAFGVAFKPVDTVNVTVAAEYRQKVDDGARSGPTLMAYGGFGPKRLTSDWTAEGYAQAGIVGTRHPVAFADGGIRIKRPVATIGPVPVSVGVGGWMGAQKDSARVDVGPMIDFDLATLTNAPIRASVDWRQRIAGKAVPNSGVAITLATDF